MLLTDIKAQGILANMENKQNIKQEILKHKYLLLTAVILAIVAPTLAVTILNRQSKESSKSADEKQLSERIERLTDLQSFEAVAITTNRLVSFKYTLNGPTSKAYCDDRNIFELKEFRNEMTTICDKLLELQGWNDIQNAYIEDNIVKPSRPLTDQDLAQFQNVQKLLNASDAMTYSSILLDFCSLYLKILPDRAILSTTPSDKAEYGQFVKQFPEVDAFSKCYHSQLGNIAILHKKTLDDYGDILKNGISRVGYVSDRIQWIKNDIEKTESIFEQSKISIPYSQYQRVMDQQWVLGQEDLLQAVK